ncbi:DEAD/DEAH box helicase family protein [Halomonas alimentaria]|uniref:DEAD/DEAH box helicase family protein n=1 Tax=Halomonas alimentaria TaxID=147248 RepID=A0A7X4W384_9GAMM|nr:DEAD/DEAH box helicase family protein [Halomonas alimentaria]NAW33494.1 DEAD/DEAH box helicase family protein [Halomonas alimentaria]
MHLLTDIEWAGVYRSGDQNLFKELYTPALRAAVQYDRAVGFFSSQALVANLQGISSLIKNNGEMRLIIGHPLDESEFEAVKQGYRIKSLLIKFEEKLDSILENIDGYESKRLSLLSYLIASDKLRIKYAFRKRGMYHEKIGVIYDSEGNVLVFHGSANETIYALDAKYNAESISVYKSWDEHSFKLYGEPYVDGFEKLWENRQTNTATFDVPSTFYEKIKKISPPPESSLLEIDSEPDSYDEFFGFNVTFNKPKIPERLGGKEFEIRNHQKRAIKSWAQNKYKGILKLSTGSGKTITAIYAATKVYEARSKKGLRTMLIVSVPYQELARQWIENLELFNIRAIKCWQSKSTWYDDLKQEILDFNMGVIDFVSIVVVNRTMEGRDFQDVLKDTSPEEIMLIGDECHNHGSKKTSASLPSCYYRLGLSATPYRSDEDELDSPFPDFAKENINNYYGEIVSEYSLGDAINDGVLCEYEYHVVPVYLTQEEQDEYEYLSNEIAKLVMYDRGSKQSNENNELTRLCGQRSRLLGAAQNKLIALNRLARSIPKQQRSYSLFYCGEGRASYSDSGDEKETSKVIEEVSKVLDESGWHTSRFTSQESKRDRASIMENFKNGTIDALVSMKVLDEGVDVPICDKAFIIASTRNPRQYIQRRGRVLRKHSTKDSAAIYDFVVLPIDYTSASQKLKEAELERVDDFALLAINRFEVEKEIEALGIRSEQ